MLALTPPSGYLLATGTVLAGLFALPDSAEAKIVYTPANEHLVCQSNEDGCSGNIYLSLNHGTSPDFRLKARCATSAGFWIGLLALGEGENEVWTLPAYSGREPAAALRSGAVIRSAKHFRSGAYMFWSSENDPGQHGPWVRVHDRYLGLKFLINGKVHYGWARLNSEAKHWYIGGTWATLTGYAYETIPGKPIKAGKTHGKDEGTLGRLAQGASGR